jgi:hypothetical protein
LLSIGLSKVIILVEDYLSARRTRMWGLDLREWVAWSSSRVKLLLAGKDLMKLGWETVQRISNGKRGA